MDFKARMITIGENIRSLREGKGMSRKEVQNLTQISQQYIGEVERGEGNPTLEILFRLGDVYNKTISELIGDPFETNITINRILNKMDFQDAQSTQAFLSVVESLSTEDINILIKLIKHFKKV